MQKYLIFHLLTKISLLTESSVIYIVTFLSVEKDILFNNNNKERSLPLSNSLYVCELKRPLHVQLPDLE